MRNKRKGKRKETNGGEMKGLHQYTYLGTVEHPEPAITKLLASGANRPSGQPDVEVPCGNTGTSAEKNEREEQAEEELRREKIAMDWLSKSSSSSKR